MRKILLIAVVTCIYGCSTLQETEKEIAHQDSIEKVSYYPIQPVNYSDFYTGFDYFGGKTSPYIATVLKNADTRKDDLLGLFPNESARIYIEEYDSGGKISYGVASVSKADKIYHITVDYLKYRTDSI